jgi:hypothetical protein
MFPMKAASISACHGVSSPSDARRRLAREALVLARRMEDRLNLVFGLAVIAEAAANTGRPELAGRLWGAIETEEAREPLGQWDDIRERFAARLLAHGGEDFERARRQGRTLPLDQAVEYALAES